MTPRRDLVGRNGRFMFYGPVNPLQAFTKWTLQPRSRDRYFAVMCTHWLRPKDGASYFATFSCHEWVPLFSGWQAYDMVYNWMRIAHEMGYRFFGHAILPNHPHFVIRVPDGGAIITALATANGPWRMSSSNGSTRQDDKTSCTAGEQVNVRRKLLEPRVFKPSKDLVERFSGTMMEPKPQ